MATDISSESASWDAWTTPAGEFLLILLVVATVSLFGVAILVP